MPRNAPATNTEPDRFMSRKEVMETVTLSYPMIWRKMRDGNFPRGREVGGRTCWLASEVFAWMRSRPVKRLKGENAAA
jgi:predicted DNA-binding transcriptional regulator AlpA